MKKFIRSLGFAFEGIMRCLPGGTNLKVQLVLGALTFSAGFILHINATEWLVVTICSMLVLSLEMLNTAIEKLCDLVTTGFNPQVKLIKDVAAGAVLLSAIGSLVAGSFIFFPKILSLLRLATV